MICKAKAVWTRATRADRSKLGNRSLRSTAGSLKASTLSI